MKVSELEAQLIAEYKAAGNVSADKLTPRQFLGLCLTCDGVESALWEFQKDQCPEEYALFKSLLESCEDWPLPPPEPWGKGLAPGDNPWDW